MRVSLLSSSLLPPFFYIIYPSCSPNILWIRQDISSNVRTSEFKNPLTGSAMEIDVWIPSLHVCFEFQVFTFIIALLLSLLLSQYPTRSLRISSKALWLNLSLGYASLCYNRLLSVVPITSSANWLYPHITLKESKEIGTSWGREEVVDGEAVREYTKQILVCSFFEAY